HRARRPPQPGALRRDGRRLPIAARSRAQRARAVAAGAARGRAALLAVSPVRLALPARRRRRAREEPGSVPPDPRVPSRARAAAALIVTDLKQLSQRIDDLTERVGRTVRWLILVMVLISAGNALVRYTFHLSSNAWLE